MMVCKGLRFDDQLTAQRDLFGKVALDIHQADRQTVSAQSSLITVERKNHGSPLSELR
jgi:hypothetical protein